MDDLNDFRLIVRPVGMRAGSGAPSDPGCIFRRQDFGDAAPRGGMLLLLTGSARASRGEIHSVDRLGKVMGA